MGVRGATTALLLTVATALVHGQQARAIELKHGLVITRSTQIARKHYRLPADASLDSAVIVIRGDDITLDLNGSTIAGTDPTADPDLRAGVAIRIDGGKNITIRNGAIHGYRVGILARGTAKLTLSSLDVGGSWKPRLYSLVEHESLADWLSFHHNEKREWLRFGSGAYLDSVSGGEIRGVTAEGGMNGIMLVKSDHLRIHDNTIQFNSGLGIGLYRSSDNVIVHNGLDYNVRGYSHGFYKRGQDSADLLFFEQSSNNIVAYNSATHGGDGIFLWAGQSTMDSGTGGANGNLFLGNDFSFAPTNAMEATFSRNAFVNNRAAGSDYGLWGGYSYYTVVSGNCFAENRVGIAIEHGQDNDISRNRFDRDITAIRIWGDSIEPSDWGYPKHHATASRAVHVWDNLFVRNQVGLRVANTKDLAVNGNRFVAVDSVIMRSDTGFVRWTKNVVVALADSAPATACAGSAPLPTEMKKRLADAKVRAIGVPSSALSKRDRSAIIVGEWGPYDWRSPELWPVDSTHAVPLRLAVLGPEGRWTLASRRGLATLSTSSGKMNDTVVVTPSPDSAGDWELTLEYRGKSGAPVRFSYGVFEPKQEWRVRLFTWSDSTDPQKFPAAFESLLRGAPSATASASRLDFEWYRPTTLKVPLEKWALDATTTVTLSDGNYTLRTISDDAVRVWLDGKLAIDDWTPHESAVDVAPLMGGRHELRVQYFQADGWAELRLDILRGTQRAGGSPGPH